MHIDSDKNRLNPNINIISSNIIEIDARAIPFDIFQSYLNDKMTQKKNFLSLSLSSRPISIFSCVFLMIPMRICISSFEDISLIDFYIAIDPKLFVGETMENWMKQILWIVSQYIFAPTKRMKRKCYQCYVRTAYYMSTARFHDNFSFFPYICLSCCLHTTSATFLHSYIVHFCSKKNVFISVFTFFTHVYKIRPCHSCRNVIRNVRARSQQRTSNK